MSSSTERLRDERAQIHSKAAGIAQNAKDAGRGFTPAERTEIDAAMKRVDDLDGQIKDSARNDRLFGLVSADAPTPGSHQFLDFKARPMARRLLRSDHAGGEPKGIKALVGAGGSLVGLPMLPGTPVDEGRPAAGLLDVIPAEQVTREFAYLRQTARTNTATVVASGAVKPTSTYTLERVEEHLRVVAHLSEPVDKFWLEDGPTLVDFIGAELVHGLRLGVEDQILNGTGTGDTFTGLNTTSGIQAQPFTTDMIRTARNGLTAAQTAVDEGGGFYVFHPADWATIELSTVGSNYAMNSAGASVPVDRAARRLWGEPVVLSTAQPAGTGIYAQRESVRLFANGEIRVEWATAGDDFTRNLLRARCEGRFGFAVPRPLGVVKLDLTAA